MPRGRIAGFVTSTETRAKLSAALRGRPKSAETRARMSAAKMGHKGASYWLGKTRGPHSPTTRAKMSAAAIGKPKSAEHAERILAGRWHGPRPVYRGIAFRSSYEVRFAKVLDAGGIAWQYEPRRFNLGTCSYLPDFYLPAIALYVEVKGYFSDESQRKVALFRATHPEAPLVVVMRGMLEQLERQHVNAYVNTLLRESTCEPLTRQFANGMKPLTPSNGLEAAHGRWDVEDRHRSARAVMRDAHGVNCREP